jgi:hypothetical protein
MTTNQILKISAAPAAMFCALTFFYDDHARGSEPG